MARRDLGNRASPVDRALQVKRPLVSRRQHGRYFPHFWADQWSIKGTFYTKLLRLAVNETDSFLSLNKFNSYIDLLAEEMTTARRIWKKITIVIVQTCRSIFRSPLVFHIHCNNCYP